MDGQHRLLKWILVVLLVAIALGTLYPPRERLKGGIDLVGGASLLFEIDTTGMQAQQKQDLANRVINILKNRVDPNAQMNLVWRPVGANRIEVQMPMPTAEARERRDAYEKQRTELLARNVSTQEIQSWLNTAPEDRQNRMGGLVRGVEERRALLVKAAEKFDAFQKVKGSDDVIAEHTAMTEYEAVVQAALDSSLGLGRLTDVLDLTGKDRIKALEELKKTHPSYADGITKVVAAYDIWAAQKGTMEDPSDLKRRIRGAGVLEFRILAARSGSNPTMIESEEAGLRRPIQPYVEELQKRGPRLKDPGDPFRWFPVKNAMGFTNATSQKEFEQKRPAINEILEPYLGTYYVLVHNDSQKYGLTKDSGRWELRGAFPSYDSRSGRPAVDFQLDARGAKRFGELTRTNLKRQLCIFLDGTAQSHATIQSQIFDRGQISGDFSQDEVRELVNTLEAGSLPARVKETPLMEKTVGPSLGERNRTDGMRAAVIAFVAVVIMVAGYYLFAGVVADVALLLNLLFTLAVMAMLEATFTLPGIAGVMLTVGMAVDANVLINERMREERERGVSLKKSVKAGYDRAFSAILDSNLTTLLTCVILGYVGSEEVKGFALTLGFGIATSMFTALVVTRLIFDTLISAGWIKSLPMLKLMGVPKVAWMSLRNKLWAGSLITTAVGMGIFIYLTATNKEKLYDIEFLGGTSVQIELKPGIHMDDQQIRSAITGENARDGLNAVAWLDKAADSLAAAEVKEGPASGQFTLTSPSLTGDQIGVLLRTTFENRLGRGGITAKGNSAVFETKTDSGIGLEQVKIAVAEAAGYVRQAARERLAGAKVQTVRDIEAASGAPEAFEIVTVETNRDLVQTAVVAVLGDKLEVQRPVRFELVADAAKAPDGFFPIEEGDRYLDDVVPNAGQHDIQKYKGGLVLVFDQLDPPQTTQAISDRIREVRLQPEYEAFEGGNHEVIGLTEASGTAAGDGAPAKYTKAALVVGDENIFYDPADPGNWRQSLAQPQYEQAKAAFAIEKTLRKVVQFAPSVASRTQTQATMALVISMIGMVAYLWIRFGTMQYGLAAIVALMHDVAIVLGLYTLAGFFGLGNFKIDMALVAAVLTIIGYSVNDTIVVFDRIRENRGKLTTLTGPMIDLAVNQTMSRTLLTGATTIVSLIVMLIWGGSGVQGFALAFLIGVITGTYSSFAIAATLLMHPRVLKGIMFVMIALGLFGLIAAVSGARPVMVVGGVILAVLLVASLVLEHRSYRRYAP